jgi:hypothetical protein
VDTPIDGVADKEAIGAAGMLIELPMDPLLICPEVTA